VRGLLKLCWYSYVVDNGKGLQNDDKEHKVLLMGVLRIKRKCELHAAQEEDVQNDWNVRYGNRQNSCMVQVKGWAFHLT
jgi:hypothetical protein